MENRNLVCPHCQSQMLRVRKPKNIYWACKRCGGRSSTISLMRRSMPVDLVNRLWQESRHGNPPKLRPCPSCSQPMCQLAVKGKPFMIDVCRTCTLVWFDPAEYEAMPQLRQQPEPVEKPLPPEARRLLAMEDIRQRRQMAKLEKQAPDELWKIVPAVLGMPVEFDYKHTRKYPVATWSIAIMVLLFSTLAFFDLEHVVDTLGFIPAEWNRMGGFTFLTSFFLHSGLFHLVGNLYFLLVFGDNVEDHLGSAWYVFLLLVAMFAGGIGQTLVDPASLVPCIGASGGISALLVYYALQFPGERVGFIFWFRWIRVPVMGYVIFWVVLQVAGTQMKGSPIAYGAHLGGAVAGLLFWLMQKYIVKVAR